MAALLLLVFASADTVNKSGWKLGSGIRAFRFHAFVREYNRKSENVQMENSMKLQISDDGTTASQPCKTPPKKQLHISFDKSTFKLDISCLNSYDFIYTIHFIFK